MNFHQTLDSLDHPRSPAGRTKAPDFTDILDTLDARGPEGDGGAEAAEHAPYGRHATDWLFQLLGNVSGLWSGGGASAMSPTATPYADIAAEIEAERPQRTEQDEIIAELGLNAHLSEAELKRIRRSFAMENHPDRLAPEVRLDATRRMTIANMLIDQLLKQKAAAH